MSWQHQIEHTFCDMTGRYQVVYGEMKLIRSCVPLESKGLGSLPSVSYGVSVFSVSEFGFYALNDSQITRIPLAQ